MDDGIESLLAHALSRSRFIGALPQSKQDKVLPYVSASGSAAAPR